MQPCNACRELESRPACPHMVTSPLPAPVDSGRRANMTKVSSNWNCTVCGSWLYQNTADGEPPNEWAMGERPLDRPEKG
jgi:hypothetical protein